MWRTWLKLTVHQLLRHRSRNIVIEIRSKLTYLAKCMVESGSPKGGAGSCCFCQVPHVSCRRLSEASHLDGNPFIIRTRIGISRPPPVRSTTSPFFMDHAFPARGQSLSSAMARLDCIMIILLELPYTFPPTQPEPRPCCSRPNRHNLRVILPACDIPSSPESIGQTYIDGWLGNGK